MSKFLLTISEKVGTRYESVNKVLVRATHPGYAKYHWHRRMNHIGAQKTGDHEYEHHDLGFSAELEGVRQVEDDELPVLEDVLPEIPGFDPE